jgi:hypothetical protein
MKFFDKLLHWFPVRPMTPGRMAFALMVAVVADGIQASLAVPGAFGPDQIIDVVAMILSARALGFHMLLLPTFILDFIPGVGLFPTWIACNAAVIAMRKRAERNAAPPVVTTEVRQLVNPPKDGPPPVI